jgi:hypothetical protein
MNKIKELKPVLHFKKDNYVYRYVLVDRFKHGGKIHYGFDSKEEKTEKEIWKSLTPRKLRRNYIITNDNS